MKNILIIGANSAIAVACARQWALEPACFFLVARNVEKLDQVAADLRARGASQVQTCALDLNDLPAHEGMLAEAFANLGRVDVCLIAHGTLPDQAACQRDVEVALREFSSNGLSVIALLTRLANRMEEQHTGTLAVISSVAGDRGRPSNYLYGTAKAAVSTFCEGLRARMFKVGVHVLTIKPGFVDTPMTQGLPLPKALVATPEQVGGDIVRAIGKKKDCIYTPTFWIGIMFIIKNIPNAIFKRLSL
ncbi:short-chain dehydrogenase [Pseudomonas sp. AU11447]|uniref:SDR family oxidoreductase n=1 Tax=unclassified Pseudomonas TaxID=196821 RepID=UPI0006D48866|nr:MULTISPECIES: SDR family oxidoreductase [unclassified Pseudomonas]OBY92661.1 short-chain dehydrogenase [Pseudomonas sp. AU11447]